MRNDDYSDVRNSVTAALVLWAGAVLAGTRADVFGRLPAEAFAALAAFAVAWAVAMVTVDARLRAWLERHDVASAWLALAGIDLLVVAAGRAFEAGRAGGDSLSPWAPIVLFGLPVTAALAVSAARSLRGACLAAFSRRESKAPSRRPAST